MADNLVEMLRTSLMPALAGRASTYLGELETTTRSAMGAAIPAVLAGLAQQGSTPSGAAQLYETITSPQIDPGLASDFSGWLGGGNKTASLLSQGSALLKGLFGEKIGAVADAISSVSGMKMASVSTLLSLAVPGIFAFLKRYLGQNRMDAGGLATLLAGQREHLRSGLDDRITSALGFASPGAFLSSLGSGIAGSASAAAGRVTETAREVGSGAARTASAAYATASGAIDRVPPVPLSRRGWFWGLLALAALVLFGLFSYWTTPVDQAAKTAQTVARAVKSLDLPGGTTLEVTTGGFLDSLTAFLAEKGSATGKSFTFDELQFETGSTTLTPASNRQLDGLAAVLKAYGDVSVNVAGHTDNTGDAAANKRLSAERAAAVKQALVTRGLPAARITDEGFGPEKPIASNDTEDGRAKNRRVELAVVKR